MIAADYPLLELFWTMLWFFLWVAWLMLLFRTLGDIFRSRDLGGGAKALWTIFVVVLPFLGVFVYLMARGTAMHERDREQALAQDQAFRGYVQDAASTSGSADELVKLADLRDRGVLSDAEFQQQKARILG
jgi:Short C-terminal domain/Phospholipase_D-nuclease N-terminal